MDSRGELWLGTESGLYRNPDPDSEIPEYKLYQPVPGDRTSLPGMHINYIFEDSGGRIWISCRGASPCYYDRNRDSFVQLVENPDNTVRLSFESQVRYETRNGELWAINSGVYKLIPPFLPVSDHTVMASNVIECVAPHPTGHNLSNFYTTHQDQTGSLWLGDKSMGLFKMTETGENNSDFLLENFAAKDGLPSNFIVRIQEDKGGYLWLGTNMGLSKFDPETGTFTNFNEQDGLPINRFQNASAINSRGEVFFGTDQGMVSFHPDSIRINTRIPPVKLTGFLIHNQEIIPSEDAVLNKSIQYTDRVTLSYKQNSPTLSFAVLSYIQPERNQYKYMLQGLDKDWVYAGQRNSVTYAGLKSGSYVFRVTGSNNHGLWNEDGATLSIHILPPPWFSWWAYMCYALCVVIIGMIIWRYLANKAKMRAAFEIERIEKRSLLELDRMKSRFFTNISHEFRTPLTLITGPVNDLLSSERRPKNQEKKLLGLIRQNTNKLHRLINQLLEISRLESGSMNLAVSEGDLTAFFRVLAASFISRAESRKIQYRIDMGTHSEPVYFDGDKIEKITSNLVSNAFKYTPEGGSIEVSLKYLPHELLGRINQVKISVSDTGTGIAPEEQAKVFDRFYQVGNQEGMYVEGTGIGLALIKEIVELYRGEIFLESKLGKGSTFSVILPVSRDSFRENELARKPTISTPELILETDFNSPDELNHKVRKDSRVSFDSDKPMVLIVEDNADLRVYLSNALGNNFQIVEAGNGTEGLEKAREIIPELVITDLMMPVRDGLEMCRFLKQDERTNHIPIIVLTARADQESLLDSLETGADEYLVKPFDSSELNARAKNLILQRTRLRQKFSRDFFLKDPHGEMKHADLIFLEKAAALIRDHLADGDFTVESFSKLLNMSNSQLYRKIFAITSLSPSQLIRNVRLKHSLTLLENGKGNVAQVAYQVGFNDHAYFTKCFRELYGITPSEYAAGKKPQPSAPLKGI